jgi:hypothetical protein
MQGRIEVASFSPIVTQCRYQYKRGSSHPQQEHLATPTDIISCHLPSTIYHLPSTIYHLPSTIYELPKMPSEEDRKIVNTTAASVGTLGATIAAAGSCLGKIRISLKDGHLLTDVPNRACSTGSLCSSCWCRGCSWNLVANWSYYGASREVIEGN